MIFSRVTLAEAQGAILAHSLKTPEKVLRKGALIDPTAYALLQAAGYDEVTVARLEAGDTPEGAAATQLGGLLLGPGFRRSEDVHGRVNLFAEAQGLLRLDASKIERLNLIDESVTLATLPDRSVVAPDDMVATLKIIPFAVSAATMAAAEALIGEGEAAFVLKPFRRLTVGLVLTTLPQLKEAAISHTIAATEARIGAHGGAMLPSLRTAHETPPLAEAIRRLLADGADMVLISGASAVTDRRDIAPRAIVEAGGRIDHFGMPVDPGNLICFGEIGGRPAIVLPGCARSPVLNGIDWVLDRLFAGEAVGATEVARMGVGGLLKEMETRPAPRLSTRAAGYGAAPQAPPRIAAIVLAAGNSTRMAPDNKLLAALPDGRVMIARTVDNVLGAAVRPVLVVTGHQDAAVRQALAGRAVRFIHASDYQAGLAASLHAGVAALAANIGAALICLGDMPLVEPAVLNALLAAFDQAEGREIVMPSFDGQRGNPVLWGRRFFTELLALTGDAGARQILHRHMEAVVEVPVETDAVLRDFDTKEALAGWLNGAAR